MEAVQDTTVPPVDPGQEPVAQETAPEPVVQEPVVPEVPLEDRVMQKFQSWQGRRDAQLREEFQGQINQIIQAVQTRNAPQAEETDPTTELLNNPTAFIDRYVEQKMSQRETVQTQQNQALITSAVKIMESDPDFSDQSFGFAVIDKIKEMNMKPLPNVPPEVNAELMLSKAKASVLASKNAKKNPMSGHKPVTVPLGTVAPSATPSPAKPVIKVDDEVRAYGKKLGMSDDEIDETLKG